METWLREIERAHTAAEVLASARDYVSLWSPRELPAECRAIRIEQEADIPRLQAGLESGSPEALGRQAAERLRELSAYLARASQRLQELP